MTQNKYPFHDELLNDVWKDFISHSFVYAPSHPVDLKSLVDWCCMHNYPGVKEDVFGKFEYDNLFPWFFTKSGISLADDPWHISQIDSRCALILQLHSIHYYYEKKSMPVINIDKSHAAFAFSHGRINFDSKIEKVKTLSNGIKFSLIIEYEVGRLGPFFNSGKRSLISRHVLNEIERMSTFEPIEFFPKEFMSQIVEEWKNENWVLWRIGDCPSPGFGFEKFAAENDGKNYDQWPCVLAEWYFKDPKPQLKESELSPLAKVWKEVVGSPIIPFDLEERRQMKVYKELKPYIEAHEKMKKK